MVAGEGTGRLGIDAALAVEDISRLTLPVVLDPHIDVVYIRDEGA